MFLGILALVLGLVNAFAVQKDDRYLEAQFDCLKEFCGSPTSGKLNSCYFDAQQKQLIFDSTNQGHSYYVANAAGAYMIDVAGWVKRIAIKFPDQNERLMVDRGGYTGEREAQFLAKPSDISTTIRLYSLSEKRRTEFARNGIYDMVGMATVLFVRQSSLEFMKEIEQDIRTRVTQSPFEEITSVIEDKRRQYLDRIQTCQKAAAVANEQTLLHATDVAAKTINMVRVNPVSGASR